MNEKIPEAGSMMEKVGFDVNPVVIPTGTIGIYHMKAGAPGGQAAVLITDEEWQKLPEEFRRVWGKVGEIQYRRCE